MVDSRIIEALALRVLEESVRTAPHSFDEITPDCIPPLRWGGAAETTEEGVVRWSWTPKESMHIDGCAFCRGMVEHIEREAIQEARDKASMAAR